MRERAKHEGESQASGRGLRMRRRNIRFVAQERAKHERELSMRELRAKHPREREY